MNVLMYMCSKELKFKWDWMENFFENVKFKVLRLVILWCCF